MKKKCAVFTISKNEDYFLPIWVKHYKKYFSSDDIYILDHQSDDGSTDNLDVNVIKVVNELAFNHQWLVNVVQAFQRKLLEQYECVLFCEADEIIYCLDKQLNEMIDDFLNDEKSEFISTHGYEVKQNDDEKPITGDDYIVPNRNWWFKTSLYDKTLLSKKPLHWIWGFHYIIKDPTRLWQENNEISRNYINSKTNKDYNLYLLHLHRVDYDLMMKRHIMRSKWNQFNDGGGNHNRTNDVEFLNNFFHDIKAELEIIPQEHKNQLSGI